MAKKKRGAAANDTPSGDRVVTRNRRAYHDYHIGDTNIDRHYAEKAGFAFLYPDASIDHLWTI